MFMLPRPGGGDTGQLLTSVVDAGKPRGASYVVVEDAASHGTQARAAGAEVVIAPRDSSHGARDYTCRDPRGEAARKG